MVVLVLLVVPIAIGIVVFGVKLEQYSVISATMTQ